MNSIFDISDWEALKDYSKNAIVRYSNQFYYALQSHTSTNFFDTTLWDGIIIENGQNRPYFFWKPSYDSSVLVEPKINAIKFGDGYEQRSSDGISNSLIKCDLVFDKRTEAEARAINHFLFQRGAKNYFLFIPPTPYNKLKRFICRGFNSRYIFKDNHEIRATFEEVVA